MSRLHLHQYSKILWLFIFCLSTNVWAGSIWARKGDIAKPLYADDKANQIGDVLTIIISEDHKVDNKIKRDLERESERDLSFDSGGIQVGSLQPFPDVTVGTGSSKKLNGKSDYKDERSIEDRITVIVQDIQMAILLSPERVNGKLIVISKSSKSVELYAKVTSFLITRFEANKSQTFSW